MIQLNRLFEPISIGDMQLKNRLVMSPMLSRTETPEGEVTDYTVDYYERRAGGGVGLVIVEMATFMHEVRAPYRLQFYDDRFIPGLKRIVDVVRPHGAKIALQLNHHGAQSAKLRLTDSISVVAPSPVPFPGSTVLPREMTKDEIDEVVEEWSNAAQRAETAGFNAVEVHAAHGYLLSQFLSPFTNRRTDAYGGSLANRARFACEVIAACRRKVSPAFKVMVRFNGSDFWPGGTTPADSAQQAKLFVNAGAEALDISGGCLFARQWVFPCYLIPQGYNIAAAQAIKKAVDVPVIVVGRLNDLPYAEHLVEQDRVDLVALGRALLVDPDLPNKAKAGRLEDIRPCVACNNCTRHVGKDAATQARGSRCTVNAAFPLEKDFDLVPATEKKKVVVIGGGLAGMEAARVLAERGHTVSLLEKSDCLGGQWNVAALIEAKRGYSALTEYLGRQLKMTGVNVTLNQPADVVSVKRLAPDAVVLATGASPRRLDIPGAHRDNVFQSVDVIQGEPRLGRNVVILGGNYMGMEVADLLASLGKQVTIVEGLTRLGADMEVHIYQVLLDRLAQARCQMLTNSRAFEIAEGGVYVDHLGQGLFVPADSVVLAVGSQPNNSLLDGLKASFGDRVYAIGDCVRPRDALEAIREGAEIGRKI